MELHLTNILSDQLIKALCNTLIHSLWEGIILAVLAGIVIVLTRRSSAALRYNVMIGLLVLFSVAISFTFFMQIHFAAVSDTAPVMTITSTQPGQSPAVNPVTAIKQHNILENCIGYFNSHSDTIVLIWFLIICARCVRLAAGLHNVYYIKRNKTLPAGTYWDNKVAELSDRLGIKQTVSLLQSGIAKLPMMLGHFKPVILIPIGLLTALSEEEVESILVHELAHIHRRDYLVNLLQNLMEIVFFFNPAVLWVSALIRAERENCCDDMVIAQTESKVSYIRALVSCQEYRQTIPAYAMGLGGNSDHFLSRVKRMLSNNNQTLNKVEKMVLTICLISAVILTAAFSGDKNEKPHTAIVNKHISVDNKVITTDSMVRTNTTKGDTGTMGFGKLKVYKNNEIADGSRLRFTKKIKNELYLTYLFKKDGILYQYTALDNGSNPTYYVDGEAVSGEKLAGYQPAFDQLMSDFDRVEQPKEPAEPGQLQHNGGKGEIVDEADSAAKTRKANYNEDVGQKSLTALKTKQNILTTKEALDSMKLKSLSDRNSKHGFGKLVGTLGAVDTQYTAAAYKMKADSYAWRKKPIKPRYDNSAYQPRAPYKPQVPPAPVVARPAEPAEPAEPALPPNSIPAPPAPPKVADKITDELIKNHLIKDESNYTYHINNNDLYIDGVKQSQEIHDKVLKDIIKKPGDKINYTRTNTTKSN